MTEPDFWDVLAGGLGRDLRPLEEGTIVRYLGSIEKARPELWVVRSQIDDDRYTLASTQHEWERLNASRDELTVEDPR